MSLRLTDIDRINGRRAGGVAELGGFLDQHGVARGQASTLFSRLPGNST